MKAVRFHGIGDVRTEEIALPQPTAQQALVKIIYGGICGSDLHIYRKGMFVEKVPEIMGHEFIGRVVSVPAASILKENDIVVGDPRVTCGKCQACRTGDDNRCSSLGFIGEVSPGAFAEYLAIEPQKLIRLKDDVDTKQGALAEPLAVAVNACRNIVALHPRRVLVAGAGPIGLLITTLLKKQYRLGKVAVADIDPLRLEKAVSAGADETLLSILDTDGEYDCIVDAVGSPHVFNEVLNAIVPGGSIYISAIYEKLPEFNVNMFVNNELMLKGNNAYRFEDLKEAVEIVNCGKLDFSWLISRILPVEQTSEAFALLTAKEKADLKILIDLQRV